MEIISTYVHLNKYHSTVIIERPYGAVQLFSPVCSRFAWENGVWTFASHLVLFILIIKAVVYLFCFKMR